MGGYLTENETISLMPYSNINELFINDKDLVFMGDGDIIGNLMLR